MAQQPRESTGTTGQQQAAPPWLQRRFDEDVSTIMAALSPLPAPSKPVLIAMSGLPGSGKSYLGVRIAEQIGGVIIQSDRSRKLLVREPKYTPEEHARVFQAMHEVTRRLLAQGIPVVFDATNLKQSDRRPLQLIAQSAGVPCTIVRMVAPPEVVRERLQKRATSRDPHDFSDADWEIYQMMTAIDRGPGSADVVIDANVPTEEAIERVLAVAYPRAASS